MEFLHISLLAEEREGREGSWRASGRKPTPVFVLEPCFSGATAQWGGMVKNSHDKIKL